MPIMQGYDLQLELTTSKPSRAGTLQKSDRSGKHILLGTAPPVRKTVKGSPMAQFSGAVKLADLNDFIAPSQACIITLSGKKIGELPSDEAFAVRSPVTLFDKLI